MRNGREIWVVVPAHDEEELIARTLRGIPDFVDRVVVVDDASIDATAAAAARFVGPRIRLIRRAENGGVGAAIVDGYRVFLAESSREAACAVMAGDDQMDPADLPGLLDGLDRGAGYVKGNRFSSPGTLRAMPFTRIVGNTILSQLTKVVTGFWHVGDSQCGYTVITREALARIDLAALYPRYGFPNDLLIKLARSGVRVAEAPVRAIYADEVSGIDPLVVGPRILGILWRGLAARNRRKGAADVAPRPVTAEPDTRGARSDRNAEGTCPLRILTVTTSYPRHAGDCAGRFVRDLNVGLTALGHEVATLAPWAPGLASEEDDGDAGSVRRVLGRDDRSAELFYGAGAESNARELGFVRSVAAFRDATRAFERAIEDALPDADLVLAHWVFPCAWWAAAVAGTTPIVGVVHGADARFMRRRIAGRLVAARLRGRLDGVACVSANTWRDISARLRLPRERVVISPMGIDASVFGPLSAESREPDLVVGAGRFVRSKGFDLLIRACEGLGLRLVIAGDGPERCAMDRLSRTLGVPLELPGVLAPPALAGLFRRAASVVVPSRGRRGDRSEGVPLVAMEALACGAAVVGTDTGGLPEILHAHALAADEPSALRRMIAESIGDPDRFRDPLAGARFDRVAVAGRVLSVFPG